ncbi:unnamed protein product [Heligmosomoides polygyrus]|uniref:glucuronosyltransferase n=1 Tax=Heligmosomoides polygyrus TaxID=6339 RepID=A0A183FND0_HELPZ|nr:unnamed protein product [Heligmosomoides polygyrus]
MTLLSTFVAHPPQSLVNGVRTKEVDYGAKSEALINSWNEFQVLARIRTVSNFSREMLTFCEKAFLEIPDTTFIWHDATKTALNQTNVVYVNELTESDLLSDSRVTSTITDGRMSQLYNIMSGGKPVVCIPSNFEQQGNCDRLQQQGMAVLISCNVLTTKNVKKMIREAATPKIRDSSNLLAEALKSKLTSRKEKLARTVEFAAKHGVTPRPNSSGTDQNLLQYYHLDVFIPLLLLFVALTLLFAWIICTILSRRSKRQQQNPSSIDENKEDLADQPESATDEHSQSAPKKPAETSELDRE